jgi:menaquinone-dependent protoporphyrinogen oxidase
MNVLVAYASRNGATTGIAERLSSRISGPTIVTTVRRVDTVESLDSFDAVVLGAPVYDQAWPAEAERFVAAQAEQLAARPLWLFSVGSFGDDGRLIGPLARKEPHDIEATLAKLRPRDYRVFRGVIQKHQWPFWSRLLFHLVGGRFGDHRNWPEIEAWGEEIGAALAGRPTALGSPAVE